MHGLYKMFLEAVDNIPKEEEKKTAQEFSNLWRARAYLFGLAMADPKIKEPKLTEEVPSNPKSEVELKYYQYKNVMDYPFDILDGLAGDICFLSDFIRDEREMSLPGLADTKTTQ